MPPKDVKIGRMNGRYFIPTEDGYQPLPQLYPLDEAPDIEAETEWPKENPCIKPATDATLTAKLQISPDVAKAFTALGEACKQAAEALGRACRAAVGCMLAIASGVNVVQLIKAAEVQAAINEAPPRVRHLAEHGKKYRTRKKNINRAWREYQRRQTDEAEHRARL